LRLEPNESRLPVDKIGIHVLVFILTICVLFVLDTVLTFAFSSLKV
jgi:hypothetical protein